MRCPGTGSVWRPDPAKEPRSTTGLPFGDVRVALAWWPNTIPALAAAAVAAAVAAVRRRWLR